MKIIGITKENLTKIVHTPEGLGTIIKYNGNRYWIRRFIDHRYNSYFIAELMRNNSMVHLGQVYFKVVNENPFKRIYIKQKDTDIQ